MTAIGRSLRLGGLACLAAAAVGQAVAQDAPSSPVSPSPPAPAPAPKASPAAKPGGPEVKLRFGTHGEFDRLVLEWPAPVHIRLSVADGVATLFFDRKARLNVARLNEILPESMRPAHMHRDNLTFRVPAGLRPSDHSHGNLVIVDFQHDEDAVKPAPAPVPATQNTPVQTAAVALPPPADVEPATLAETTDHHLTVKGVPIAGGASLRFEWTDPVAAAVFRLRNTAWIVFDRPETVKIDPRTDSTSGELPILIQEKNPSATVLRLPIAGDENLVVGLAGKVWLVDVHRAEPSDSAGTKSRTVALSAKDGLYATKNPSRPVAVVDPDSKEVLLAVPMIEAAHFEANEDHKTYHVLPTAQGMLFRPESDLVRFEVEDDGLRVDAVPSARTIGSDQ